jgi:hypothetical protein
VGPSFSSSLSPEATEKLLLDTASTIAMSVAEKIREEMRVRIKVGTMKKRGLYDINMCIL